MAKSRCFAGRAALAGMLVVLGFAFTTRIVSSAQDAPPRAAGEVEEILVHGTALALGDNLIGVNRLLDRALTQAGIEHTFETYDGDHNNRVYERIETAVLPFFRHLEFE